MKIKTNTQSLTEEVFIKSFTNPASTSFGMGRGRSLRLTRRSFGKIMVKNTLWVGYKLRMKQKNMKWDML